MLVFLLSHLSLLKFGLFIYSLPLIFVILNNIFGQMSLRAARGSYEYEIKGNLLNSTAVSFNLCILNTSSQDTARI